MAQRRYNSDFTSEGKSPPKCSMRLMSHKLLHDASRDLSFSGSTKPRWTIRFRPYSPLCNVCHCQLYSNRLSNSQCYVGLHGPTLGFLLVTEWCQWPIKSDKFRFLSLQQLGKFSSIGWQNAVFTGGSSSNYYGALLGIGSTESATDDSEEISGRISTGQKERTRSYTWFFSLAARVRCPHPISFVDPSTFSNILNSDRCKRIQ